MIKPMNEEEFEKFLLSYSKKYIENMTLVISFDVIICINITLCIYIYIIDRYIYMYFSPPWQISN